MIIFYLTLKDPLQLSRDMDFLKGLIETGHYTSVMDGAYALKDMTEAQRYIEGDTRRQTYQLPLQSQIRKNDV